MRILVHGRFYPSIGGIETVVNLLAREWAAAGHQVVVVSNLACDQRGGPPGFRFRVVHQPGPIEWFRLVKWSEMVLHMNLSLNALWPHLALRRPIIISHHCFYTSCARGVGGMGEMGSMRWQGGLKLRVMRHATNIAASKAIARALPVCCKIILNPYDSALFHQAETVARGGDLVFVGRLVSEKGVDLLLRALEQLEPSRPAIRLTIIGDGPERAFLQNQAVGLSPRIRFVGSLSQQGVAEELRQHKILVVPSVYEEPFGVVALEGAACGCLVLGSDGGGLPEAIGPAGITFRRGDAGDLAAKLEYLLKEPRERGKDNAAVTAHLECHEPRSIAVQYLTILRCVQKIRVS